MQFEQGKHYKRAIKLEDPEINNVVSVEVTHWTRVGEKRSLISIFNIFSGPFDMQIDITPAQARELAKKLLEHADEVDERKAWIASENKSAA